MKSGDEYQHGHRVPKAIAARLSAIRDEPKDPRNLHQLAVCLSELAESCRLCGIGQDWKARHKDILEGASVVAEHAYWLSRDDRALACAIAIDNAHAVLRFLTHEGVERRQDVAQEAVQLIIGIWEALGVLPDNTVVDRPSVSPACWHLRAIAASFLTQVSYAEALGYALDPQVIGLDSEYWREIATSAFQKEIKTTPDGCSAHRSFLLRCALAESMRGPRGRADAKKYAREAADLALCFRDSPHLLRALGLLLLGPRSEKLFRRLRDGRLVRKLPRNLADSLPNINP